MIRKINFLVIILLSFSCLGTSKVTGRRQLKDFIGEILCDDRDEEDSIWESFPVEARKVKVQILDKISGKVFRKSVKSGETVKFRTIELSLEKAFENSPDDPREVYAFVKITENNKVLFHKWLFASSPSVNLFAHPVYDIRIEF